MKAIAFSSTLIVLAALLPTPAAAEKLGEHPAIVAARVHAAQGYDYASRFYPHPAWLYLLPQAPAAAVVERRAQQAAPLSSPQTEPTTPLRALETELAQGPRP